jgi:urocanate hydratase
MASAILPEELKREIEAVYRLYAGLARDLDPETGLGGKLLYAGELDAEGSRLVRAANIAGAASLSATADTGVQRQAIREGVIDFLVTSLDESLRILKNEIRKRNAVSVGVGIAPAQAAAEMRERGVLPDLLRHEEPANEVAAFAALGARFVAPAILPEGQEFRVFAEAPADFEARALALIPETDVAARRWLRLSPRYLGPRARRLRSLGCDRATADALTAKS